MARRMCGIARYETADLDVPATFSYFFFFFNRYQFPFLFAHIFFLRKSPYEGCTYDYTGTSAYRIWRLIGSEGSLDSSIHWNY